MAVVPRTLKNRAIVYYVTNRRADGSQLWEHCGADKRTAQRRDAQMKREIADGTYTGRPTSAASVAHHWREWSARRTNVTANDERRWWDLHVAGRAPWFVAMRMDDVQHAHARRLKQELEAPYTDAEGRTKTLTRKSVFNLFAPINTMFADACRDGIIARNPFDWPRGTFNPKPTKRRRPYTYDEVRALTTDPRLPADWAMLLGLLFYAGLREGEACGRRWRDWDRNPEPLGALAVDTQYEGRKLKTEDVLGDAPRVVPVHPELARMLEAWWLKGFEAVYCRRPTIDDYIIPCRARELRNHTRSSAYKLFRRACALVGVEPHTLHSTRHTFISNARNCGARADVLERVTHNAEGTIVDAYTVFDWEPLCVAVTCFMARPPSRARPLLHAI